MTDRDALREKTVRLTILSLLRRRHRRKAVRALRNALTYTILEAHTQGRLKPYRHGMPADAYGPILDAALSEFIRSVERTLKGREQP